MLILPELNLCHVSADFDLDLDLDLRLNLNLDPYLGFALAKMILSRSS